MEKNSMNTIKGYLPLSALLWLLATQGANAQLVLNQPGTTGTHTAPTSITLAPGFQSGGPFHAHIAAVSPLLGNAASTNQNFVQRTVYLQALGGTPPAPNVLTVAQAMRDITYHDGLGRPVQEVGVRAASTARDLATPVAYDTYGRRDRDYLPYGTATGVGGAFKANAVANQATYYNAPPTGVVQIPVVSGNTPSFAPRRYEASPLDRVLEQGFPGRAWQLSGSRTAETGRTVLAEHGTNNTVAFGTAGTRRVVRYTATLDAQGKPGLNLASNAVYAAGELHLTTTRDENWTSGRGGTVEEYTDKQGRVVLRRTFTDASGAAGLVSTYYVYNDLGQLSFVLTPGAAPDRGSLPAVGTARDSWLLHHVYDYRYDARGRLVEKRIPGKGREYLVYNRLDRLVATQDAVQRGKAPQEWTVGKHDALGRVVRTGMWTHTGSTAGTDQRSTVQGQVDAQAAANQWEERNAAGTAYTNRAWPTAGLAVHTEQFYDDYNIAGFTSLPSAYRPTGHSTMVKGLPTVSRVNVLGTTHYLWTAVYYDARGNMVREVGQHYKGGSVGYATNNYDDVSTEYGFTGQVLSSTRRHYASGSLSATVRTERTYDHRDRPVDTWKTLNTGTRTLVARHTYNEVGQLRSKGLHSTDGSTFAETASYAYNPRGWLLQAGSAKFTQTLNYDGAVSGVVRQYNGNISRQGWQHQGQSAQHYNYTYDRLDRLATAVGSGGRSENVSYNAMGNITSLARDGAAAMAFEYPASGSNRLDRITGVGTTYLYDSNGNTTRDGRQNRTITYNALNLPATVGGGNAATYTYDAMGRKLRSVVGSVTTDYIDGIEWEGTSLNAIHMEEGRILPTGVYEYALRDHLGNTRSGFASNATGSVNMRSDYYPFGLRHPTGNIAPTPANRYLYNGKELQDGSGYYDYGARFYDPFIGRWGSVDPLAEHPKQVDTSPYAYAANNPIRYVDPTGMIWEDPKQAERLNKSINRRIESVDKNSTKIQAQIDKGGLSDKKLANLENRLAENVEKVTLLNQSLADVEAIGNASETFRLGSPSANNGTHGVVKGADGVITIEGSNTGLHIHEVRHVGQSIEAGGVKFNKHGRLLNSAKTLQGARLNEVNAYQTQYSFDGSYPASASSLQDINEKSLMQIKIEGGTRVYKDLEEKKKK